MRIPASMIEKGRNALKPQKSTASPELPAAKPAYTPHTTANKTISMMGNLTPEEEQRVRTETMKGGIAKTMRGDGPSRYNLPEGMSHDQWNALGMYERAALKNGTRESSEKAISEGGATLNDLLATGERSSRYGGFGTVREEVKDSRMIRGYRGYASDDSSHMRTRDRTEQEYLDDINEPKLKLFAEAEAIKSALATEKATRDHDTNLANIKADGGVAEARSRSEGSIRTAELSDAAKKRSERLKAREASGDNINNLYDSLSGVVIPEVRDAIMARIELAESRDAKEFPRAGGQGGSLDQAGFVAEFVKRQGRNPTETETARAQGVLWE